MINPKVQCQPVKEGQNIGTGQNSIKGRWSSPTNTHTHKEKRYSHNNATKRNNTTKTKIQQTYTKRTNHNNGWQLTPITPLVKKNDNQNEYLFKANVPEQHPSDSATILVPVKTDSGSKRIARVTSQFKLRIVYWIYPLPEISGDCPSNILDQRFPIYGTREVF